MFENIIGYPQLIAHLSQLVIHREIPSAILLAGSTMSGKKTIALELARVLLCEKDGKWECNCGQCNNSRVLTNPYVLLMGRGQPLNEIVCGKTMLLSRRENREKSFFIRALFKLLRRADNVLWESSDVWSRNLKSPSGVLRELVTEYQENEALWYQEKIISKLVDMSFSLEKALPSQMLPVQCIRNVLSWAMIRSQTNAKIIILDHVEDMLPSSANMMLKTLEEPPENVYFILITKNLSSLIPTVRSRARSFELSSRTLQSEQEVLRKVFSYNSEDQNSQTQITSTQEYLGQFAGYSQSDKSYHIEKIQDKAQAFFKSLLQKESFHPSLILFPSNQNMKQNVLLFLSCLIQSIKTLLRDRALLSHLVKVMWHRCEHARINIQHKNISGILELEVLYYKLMEDYELFE